MKRIIRFVLPLLMAVPGGLFANSISNSFTLKMTGDTGSNAVKKPLVSLTIQGNLADFNAAYGKSFFDLNWKTVSGDFDHFEVERSLDGLHFEKLGEVKSADIVAKDGNYFFRDHVKPVTARNNDFYYRLKQVDADGHFTYSKMLIARMFNTKTLAALSVTPDPLANNILVNVQLKENSFVVMKVSDANGNLLIKKALRADDGFNTYTLEETNKLQPGMYTLEVIVNSNERMLMKLQKG